MHHKEKPPPYLLPGIELPPRELTMEDYPVESKEANQMFYERRTGKYKHKLGVRKFRDPSSLAEGPELPPAEGPEPLEGPAPPEEEEEPAWAKAEREKAAAGPMEFQQLGSKRDRGSVETVAADMKKRAKYADLD